MAYTNYGQSPAKLAPEGYPKIRFCIYSSILTSFVVGGQKNYFAVVEGGVNPAYDSRQAI